MKKILLLLVVVFGFLGCETGGYFSVVVDADLPTGYDYEVSVYHCQSGDYLGNGDMVYADSSYYYICIEVFNETGDTVFYGKKQIYHSQLNAEYNFSIIAVDLDVPEYEFKSS